MNRLKVLAMAAVAASIVCSQAVAGIVVTQGSSAPTYTTSLNFDEVGGPTGVNVPNNSWAGSPWLIADFMSGEGSNFVGDNSGGTGSGTNSYYAPYGVFMTFAPGQDLTEMSFDAWDPSGPPTFFGGGMGIFVFNNGDGSGNDYIFADVYTPAWGGAGLQSFNITTTGGTVFDEVRILGFGNFPTTVIDNISWNAVPEPGSLSLLAIGCMAIIRRRRK